MRQTPLEKRLADIAAPIIEDMGFALVDINIVGEGGSQNVQFLVENPQTRKINLDECASVSRAVATALEVEDPIKGAYRLEVSSPGIDRPLTRTQDFSDFAGFEVKLETSMPTADGQRRFRGFIEGINDDEVITLKMDTGEADIPFSSLSKAKLVLTDDLIKKTANKK